MEFHKNGAATKKECLNALMVEDNKFKVKECVRVVNLLNWKYFVKLIAADPFKIEYNVKIDMYSRRILSEGQLSSLVQIAEDFDHLRADGSQ